MIENFNDFVSLFAIGATILFVLYISITLIKNSKDDDDDDFYKEVL